MTTTTTTTTVVTTHVSDEDSPDDGIAKETTAATMEEEFKGMPTAVASSSLSSRPLHQGSSASPKPSLLPPPRRLSPSEQSPHSPMEVIIEPSPLPTPSPLPSTLAPELEPDPRRKGRG